jgi:hypothetical protein
MGWRGGGGGGTVSVRPGSRLGQLGPILRAGEIPSVKSLEKGHRHSPLPSPAHLHVRCAVVPPPHTHPSPPPWKM